MSDFSKQSKVYMEMSKEATKNFETLRWIYLGMAFIFAILDIADAIRYKVLK